MCPSHALSGRLAIAILQLCVDCTLEPSRMVTVSGFCAVTTSATGASVTKKLFVAPESIIAQSFRLSLVKSTVSKRFLTSGVTLPPCCTWGFMVGSNGV